MQEATRPDPYAAEAILDPAFAFISPQSSATPLATALARSFLTSFIAGDELNSVGEIGSQGEADASGTAPSGVLVDPAAAEAAFLSATQLAALDHDRFTFF